MRDRVPVREPSAMGDIELRRWTREEYEKMIDAGVFPPDARAELIDGEIYTMPPQKRPHALAVRAVEEALWTVFKSGYDVQYQLPLALDPASEPEPDVTVVRGSWRDYPNDHPSDPVLVVEIADSSLHFDRTRKQSLYARARVPDFWIVNLVDRRIEVYRDPISSKEAPYGWAYGQIKHVEPGETIAPLEIPDAKIAVSDLLP